MPRRDESLNKEYATTMAPESLANLPKNLTVPLRLDAFVFNRSVCDNEARQKAKIAPITQPNYTFLRLEDYTVQHDVLDPIDLHNCAPASRNSRFTDIGQNKTRQSRVGVYLHWIVPRPFRSGIAATASAQSTFHRAQTALGIYHDSSELNEADQPVDTTVPSFLPLPNRWLVIRTLDPDASTTRPRGTSIPKVKAWVVESDRTQSIDDLSDDVDLQVDVAPYITTFIRQGTKPQDISIDEQAEVFIGSCVDATEWEEPKKNDSNPRVDLTAGSSSNQLFMDFQYHCGNVFSMVDTFDYLTEDGQVQHLEAAHASYYVMGWHSDADKDLMFLKSPTKAEDEVTREARFQALSITLANKSIPDADDIHNWLQSKDSARSLCHGALYDVEWLNKWDGGDSSFQPPDVPADRFTKLLADSKNITIGTTPVNAILSHVSEHRQDSKLEDFLYRLQTFVRSEDDSVGGQEAAADEVQNVHFARFDGGIRYTLSDQDLADPTKRPNDLQMKQLKELNTLQRLYDATQRRLKQLQWDTFAIWWKYISDVDNSKGKKDQDYRYLVDTLRQTLFDMKSIVRDLMKLIKSRLDSKDFISPKEALRGSFYQQNDPTLLLAGLESGWPKDFQSSLSVRLDNQFYYKTLPDDKEIERTYKLKCLPDDLTTTGIRLAREFAHLNPATGNSIPGGEIVPPLYHDDQDAKFPVGPGKTWRDRWSSRQPWFPLYIEWKAEYYHIPFEKWSLIDETVTPTPTSNNIYYGLNSDVTSGYDKDVRIVTGRTLILPQPAFNLKLLIERIFNTTAKEKLDEHLSKEERDLLLQGLDDLGYLSTNLAGLSDHLATRFNGTHVKPLVRVPPYAPVVLKDASEAASKININDALLAEISIESDITPYGAIVSLPGTGFCAFKPVTHGQIRFIELNVVDKFGQVAPANDPLQDNNLAIIPTISDYYRPHATKLGNKPNVVKPDIPDLDHPEFIQLPPTINQPSRMNAEFVERDIKTREWTSIDEWKNPIWGWVVVNFADRGLQFFLQDGTFYREVRATQGNQAQDVKWLPFNPPTVETSELQQLDFLIGKMTANNDESKKYLAEFWDMITTSVSFLDDAPDAYSQFLNSLVGRPLAFANMGWSLELNTDSRKNESTLRTLPTKPSRGLLLDDADKRYQFPVKFGNKNRTHDGLIGYFEPRNRNANTHINDNLVLEKCFTYYGKNVSPIYEGSNLLTHPSAKYPQFHATWLDPRVYTTSADSLEDAAAKYDRAYNKTLNIYGAIVDPFLPITAFTSILPMKSLRLPTWTWESALKKMTTFIHAGPLLVTADLPAFDASKRLTKQYNLTTADMVGSLSLPALQVADWSWLQAYDIPTSDVPSRKAYKKEEVISGYDVCEMSSSSSDDEDADDTGASDVKRTAAFMPFDVAKVDVRPSFQKGPYTAIEGYMQLKAPIENENAGQSNN